jgi:polysaccharide pyruvyl transferase WcaK-like protein
MTNTFSMRIGILGATFETPNLGVGALAAGTIRCIRARYPLARLFFLDYARQSSTHTVVENGEPIAIPLVNIRFSKRFWLPNNIAVLLFSALLLKVIPSAKLRRWLVARNRSLHEIFQADLFAAVSGGDSFSDLYGFSRFLYVALPQILVLLLGKPLILLPQTYGPFRGRLAKTVARQIVTRAERAFCRDRHSLDQLMGAANYSAPQTQQSFCYDMAFGIDSVAPRRLAVAGLMLAPQRDLNLVGLNISGLLYREDVAHANAFGLCSNYRELVSAIVRRLMAMENTSVLLVPHVYGSEPGSESDLIASEQVFAALRGRYAGRLGILRGTYEPGEVRFAIGLCGFFIGSRMHACIAALSQNIPAVAVAYSSKFLGVMETMGIPSLVADARKLDHGEILSTIQSTFENRQRIAQELELAMPAVRATVHRLLVTPPAPTEAISNPLQQTTASAAR